MFPPKALRSVGFNSEKRATRLSISSREICFLAIHPPYYESSGTITTALGRCQLAVETPRRGVSTNLAARYRWEYHCAANSPAERPDRQPSPRPDRGSVIGATIGGLPPPGPATAS